MAEPALTPDDVAELKRAIVMGEMEVEYQSGGERRRTKYRSIAEMKSALEFAEKELGTRQPVTSSYAQFDRA